MLYGIRRRPFRASLQSSTCPPVESGLSEPNQRHLAPFQSFHRKYPRTTFHPSFRNSLTRYSSSGAGGHASPSTNNRRLRLCLVTLLHDRHNDNPVSEHPCTFVIRPILSYAIQLYQAGCRSARDDLPPSPSAINLIAKIEQNLTLSQSLLDLCSLDTSYMRIRQDGAPC